MFFPPSRRPSSLALAPVLLVFTSIAAGGCALTEPDSVSDLEGVWRTTVPAVSESTVQLRSDGTLDEVVANFGSETCATASGRWSIGDGVLSVTITSRNGAPVSESEEIPVDIVGDALTLNHVGDDPETFTRIDEMVDCASYGWPTINLSAAIDGTTIVFEDHFAPVLGPGETLAELIAGGSFVLSGRNGSGAIPAVCDGCREVTIQVHGASAITPATYSMSAGNVSGLAAIASYQPDLAGQLFYWSNGSDPDDQPWEGEVVIIVANATELSGTFSFTGYDHLHPGPVRPSVSITNGAFRIVFE